MDQQQNAYEFYGIGPRYGVVVRPLEGQRRTGEAVLAGARLVANIPGLGELSLERRGDQLVGVLATDAGETRELVLHELPPNDGERRTVPAARACPHCGNHPTTFRKLSDEQTLVCETCGRSFRVA